MKKTGIVLLLISMFAQPSLADQRDKCLKKQVQLKKVETKTSRIFLRFEVSRETQTRVLYVGIFRL